MWVRTGRKQESFVLRKTGENGDKRREASLKDKSPPLSLPPKYPYPTAQFQ
jgi:hypothetical protein